MSDSNLTPSAVLSAEPAKPAAPAPESTPAPTETEPQTGDWGLTPEQLAALADSEVAAGRLSREQADQMLKADTVTAEKPAPATVAVEGFPAAQMHEYEMPDLIGDDGEYTPQVDAFNRQARTWLATAGLPKDIGSAVAAEVTKVSAELRDANEAGRELHRRTETAKLQRLWPDESAYTRRVALAVQLVNEIEGKAPGLKALLDATGAGNSAVVIAHLALHAERLHKTKYPDLQSDGTPR